MNPFRLTGDLLHLASIVIILWKILSQKSVAGLSLKTQILYSVVFVTRYCDLLWNFVSIYNTSMKLIFLITSFHIIYLMRVRYRSTYDIKNDTFRVRFLIIPCVLAALITHYHDFVELLWTFSEWLEAVAILPQLFHLQRTGVAETLTSHYLFALGGYRLMYIINWVYRWWTEGRYNWISWTAGTIQTVLYIDFFYHYLTKVIHGRKLTLPN